MWGEEDFSSIQKHQLIPCSIVALENFSNFLKEQLKSNDDAAHKAFLNKNILPSQIWQALVEELRRVRRIVQIVKFIAIQSDHNKFSSAFQSQISIQVCLIWNLTLVLLRTVCPPTFDLLHHCNSIESRPPSTYKCLLTPAIN